MGYAGDMHKRLFIILLAGCLWATAYGQDTVSDQVNLNPEVAEYQRIRSLPGAEERLKALEGFVDRYAGTQLALRAMRDVTELFILQESSGKYYPLEACATWLESHLRNPAYNWDRFRGEGSSAFIDRIETHLTYTRVLASSRTYSAKHNRFLASTRTYDRALEELGTITTEMEQRPDLLRSRTDLLEQMHLTRCWCLHGKGDYPAALRSYEWFMERFPNSDFIPATLYNAASCLRTLEKKPESGVDPGEARRKIDAYQQRLLDDYPGSAETVLLRQQFSSSNG
jgi:hypothetical protein